MELKYSQILKLNKELGNEMGSSSYSIIVLSNIIVHQVGEILEFLLRGEGVRANVEFGDYDNIVQESSKSKHSNAVIIFWELCNIIEGLQYKIELLDNNQLEDLIEKTKSEIDLALNNLERTSLVLLNTFTSLPFSHSNIRRNQLDKLAGHLNHYLEERIPSNVKLVYLDQIIASVGVSNSLDMRYFYSSKALYTVEFFKAYAGHVKPFIISSNGKAKKALIFDCDNTLWKGVLGEDGLDNIEMSSTTKDGAIFAEIQSIALALNSRGVLIGLCSKNNLGDVDEVITSHPHMQLRDEHITINKSNWTDKVSNLREIAHELNVGLDSLVFIDDSSFEVALVREQLPEVTVLQVPEKLHEYPTMLRINSNLFYNLSSSPEDQHKVKIYKQQAEREGDKKNYNSIEDYLKSLDLMVTVLTNDESITSRMAQLSQKTNQFNLTTKRYTESDIKKYIIDPNSDIFAFSVSDKFGSAGVAALSIITKDGKGSAAEIDTLLMSCRVIGRNLEYAIIDYIIGKIKESKIDRVVAKYTRTHKNEHVKEFFDGCSFTLIDEDESAKKYTLEAKDYSPKNISYINITDGITNGQRSRKND